MKAHHNSNKFFVVLFIIAFTLLCSATATAQSSYKTYFANADWQFNVPINNDFTSKASGWGMNFEGGYFVSPHIGIELFVSYSTNHKYIPTETISIGSTESITTNQQRSTFQIPFGAGFRFRLAPYGDYFDPYISMKFGAEYCQLSSFVSTYKIYDRNWGFYMSPELGTNIWFSPQKNIGLHASLYYSFATNKGSVLNGSVDKLHNFGFRVGLAF